MARGEERTAAAAPSTGMNTFKQRFWHFVNVTDPRSLLIPNSQILEAANCLRRCKETGLSCGSERDMESYQRLVDATVHPTTGNIIPAPFRVSAIAPVNIPIVYAMLATPASNWQATLFLHWFNQSYNTACNYCNAAGTEQAWQDTAKAYGLATVSACSLAFGLGKAFERAPASVRKYGIIIPCLATAAANCSNLVFTRMGEISDGTPVSDAEGNIVGLSTKAGAICVAQTAATRCVLVPAACLLLPPAILGGIKTLGLAPLKSPRGMLFLELSIIYLSLQAALPAALAVYPQQASFAVSALEEKFTNLNLKDSTGRPVERLFANKGL